MRNFKSLIIWQKGIEISINCYRLTKGFPKEEKYGIISQMTRAAISISSNIAEGCSRSSERDFKRFLEISLGSTFGLETQMIISNVNGWGDADIRNDLSIKIDEDQKMLISFLKNLNNRLI